MDTIPKVCRFFRLIGRRGLTDRSLQPVFCPSLLWKMESEEHLQEKKPSVILGTIDSGDHHRSGQDTRRRCRRFRLKRDRIGEFAGGLTFSTSHLNTTLHRHRAPL